MSKSMRAVHAGRAGGTTDDDRRTALRFVVGRPGWRVEAQATTEGEAYLRLATPCSNKGDQRFWFVARGRQGLLVGDEASGQRLWTVPTMRDALVEIWEAVTGAAPD